MSRKYREAGPAFKEFDIPGGPKAGNDPYFEWLCNKVRGEYYHELLYALYDIQFHSSNELDKNRISYALALRDEYEARGLAGCPVEGCTVLEVMMSMAIRCEDTVMNNPNKGDRTLDWFWQMIDNLGFSKFTDGAWNAAMLVNVNRTINDWLERRFKRNGLGSPWPLSEGRKDCRRVDLWTAMMWYMSENYITGGDDEVV